MVSVTPVSDLLARASSREVVRPGDARSLSVFERVTLDGERYFVKRLSPASDWIMRVTGDHVHRPYLVWRAGIMDRVPACIDHTVVAMEVCGEGDDAELSMFMRDVGPHLVPEGDTVVSDAQHQGFIDPRPVVGNVLGLGGHRRRADHDGRADAVLRCRQCGPRTRGRRPSGAHRRR